LLDFGLALDLDRVGRRRREHQGDDGNEHLTRWLLRDLPRRHRPTSGDREDVSARSVPRGRS
jgi:hypothetical protein